MMKLNSPTILIFIFALTSLASLLTSNWVAAAAFATMAASFALSGPTYVAVLSSTSQREAPTLPAWRRDSSLLLVGTAIVLFSFQIGQALHQAINHFNH